MYSVKNVFLLVILVATAIAPVYAQPYAAPGDQTIVKDYNASTGWTSVVPMDVDGSDGTDLISYNAETGHAIVSVGTGTSGDQTIVKDYIAAPGWTSVVPMDVDGSGGLNDLISYNAETGHAIVSVGTGTSGDQTIVKDYIAAPGWTSVVPMDVDGSGGTDLISYNAETGHAIVSVGTGTSGDQTIVKDYIAAPGWTSVVPMDVDGSGGLNDLISYNAETGHAIVSVGTGTSGDQTIVKDYMASPGWTIIVPINADCDPYGLTDLISYNAETGHAIVSVGTGTSGDQTIVKDYIAAPGWTSVVPMNVDGSGGTDLISYNAETGHAIVSVGECNPAQNPPSMPPSGGSNPAQNPPSMTCSNADYDTPATQLSQEAAETAVLCLINEQRIANGVPALKFNQQLRDAARLHANDASTIKWWAGGGNKIHTNPVTGSTPQSRIKDAGYCPGEVAPPTNENGYDAWYKGGIEYQGSTTPRAAVTWWMNSEGHRTTLLNPIYTESGVGVVLGVAEQGNEADTADGGAIFVQTFGGCTTQ